MSAVICLRCEHIGPPLIQFRDATVRTRNGPVRTQVQVETCELCDCRRVEPITLCVACGRRPIEVEGTDLCTECYIGEHACQP